MIEPPSSLMWRIAPFAASLMASLIAQSRGGPFHVCLHSAPCAGQRLARQAQRISRLARLLRGALCYTQIHPCPRRAAAAPAGEAGGARQGATMRCPHCGFDDSKVIDSRDNGETVQRRRRCERCNERFTTVERIVLNELMLVKRDGRREPFSREKLEAGLRHACQKATYRRGPARSDCARHRERVV